MYMAYNSPYLIGPGARYPGEFLHTTPKLHVLMCRVHIAKTRLDMWSDASQGLSTQQDPGAAHTEVLVVLQAE
jgi:hypothetical protein